MLTVAKDFNFIFSVSHRFFWDYKMLLSANWGAKICVHNKGKSATLQSTMCMCSQLVSTIHWAHFIPLPNLYFLVCIPPIAASANGDSAFNSTICFLLLWYDVWMDISNHTYTYLGCFQLGDQQSLLNGHFYYIWGSDPFRILSETISEKLAKTLQRAKSTCP